MAKTVVKSGDTNQDATRSTIRAAIDALPNELLALIFMMGAAFQPRRRMPLSFMTWHFALVVSSVSRRWRDVAISSRPLWSYLCFTADERRDTLFATIFLPRSGAHPLEISVRPGIAGTMHSVLKIILPHCARWRTFYVRPRDDADLNLIVLHTRDISVPLLQHIVILCPIIHQVQYHGGIREHRCHSPPFISGAPALTSVGLRALCVKCGPSLTNLTSFEFDSALTPFTLTQSDLESIAVASPALRVLRLRVYSFKMSGGTITIPSLRDLSLRFRGCEYLGANMRLFASMHAPNLESLELNWLQDNDMDSLWFYCQKFPDYPRPQTLKLFRVESARASCSSYDTLFELFPSITSLYINHNEALVKPVLSQLPTLSSLTYNCMRRQKNACSTSPAQYKYINCIPWILSHVQDCHGTPRAMQSVRIGYSARRNRSEEDYQRLRDLVDLVELADEDGSLQESWSSDDCNDDEGEDLIEDQWTVKWGDVEWGDI